MPPAETPTLAAIADRAGKLHSPPAVAMEVLRLTDEPQIDARALCRCIEGDPALASKLLRVVNSSLYGLPQEVASLSQAIALLGVKPLKLLVLGFSLPEGIAEGLTGGALQRYWTETLTTAAAARRFAVAGWGRLGDEALAAGLMQGVGQLVLLSQLGDEYASLIDAVASSKPRGGQRPTLAAIETQSLGFEHRELSAEMLRRWNLPLSIAEAINQQAGDNNLDHLTGDTACLAQSLRLANLLTQILLRRDLSMLSTLLTCGQNYGDLTLKQINTIVGTLQGEAAQLGEAMAAPLSDGGDYQQTLIDAHARLSLLSEESAVRMIGDPRDGAEIDEDEQLCRDLLLETRRLAAAMRVMLAGGLEPRSDEPHAEPHQPASVRQPLSTSADPLLRPRSWLLERIDAAILRARESRSGLTLSILKVSPSKPHAEASVLAFRDWVAASPWASDLTHATWAPTTRDQATVWLPGIDRLEANRLWSAVAIELTRTTPVRLDVGIAGVAHPTPSFDSEPLLAAAERCLAGAVSAAGPTVKSIEVF
ncbi:HDOD domain protein [Botrimarina colliarenosi]|uniref:HDOD domain protein n=1 Tax=Botrimarina colliarenosi TaxID=2528001 RepID=A0A5C6AJH6_9BACT|nr:HDOD domain-containing protein [Botrimarina colliarenosi]TWT99799.1 HDOD domain protein [Botrimarina colliarenosi]